jgi:MtN3 and saliva related transmembrane protein
MDEWTYLALVAGAMTSTGYLPQIVKGLRTRSMADVSLLMPAILGIGMFLWLLYGFARDDVAIIAANTVGCTLTFTLVVLKLRFDSRRNATIKD